MTLYVLFGMILLTGATPAPIVLSAVEDLSNANTDLEVRNALQSIQEELRTDWSNRFADAQLAEPNDLTKFQYREGADVTQNDINVLVHLGQDLLDKSPPNWDLLHPVLWCLSGIMTNDSAMNLVTQIVYRAPDDSDLETTKFKSAVSHSIWYMAAALGRNSQAEPILKEFVLAALRKDLVRNKVPICRVNREISLQLARKALISVWQTSDLDYAQTFYDEIQKELQKDRTEFDPTALTFLEGELARCEKYLSEVILGNPNPTGMQE